MRKIKNYFVWLLAVILVSVHSGVALISASTGTQKFTTKNGAEYSVECDSDNITLSEAVNSALVIQANNAVNQAGSAVHVTTETMYPILSATYDLQCNFGSLDSSSYFGFQDIDGKQFLLRVSHSSASNTTTLKISIDGQDYVCGTYPNRLRTRVYNIGVAEVNGSYYVTYDGIAVTGDGYSDDVKEALKLEKTFLKQALSNDTMFRFVFGANSLDKYAYFHPNIMYANGYAVKVASIYSDRNCGGGNLTAVEHLKNKDNATSVTYTDGVFAFNLSNRTIIGLLSPVNVSDGIYLDVGTMAGFYGYYTLANNLSKTLNPIKFTIYSSYGTQQNQIFANHATTTNVQAGGPKNFNYFHSNQSAHAPWRMYVDASNKLALNGPSTYGVSVATTLDCSALSHATNNVYFEYYASEHSTTTTFNINPNIVSENVVTLPEDSSDSVATKAVLDILFADNARYFTYDYDKLVKATELLHGYYGNISAAVAQIEQKIVELPEPEALNAENYTTEIKDEVCGIYVSASEFTNDIDPEILEKLNNLIDKIATLDPEFSNSLQNVANFESAIAEIGEPDSINVENYAEKSQKVAEQREIYDIMEKNDFLKSRVNTSAVTKLTQLEDKLNSVKPAYEVFSLINALPKIEDLTYADRASVLEASDAYDALAQKEYLDSSYPEKLAAYKEALKVVMLRDADWYSEKTEVEFTGNNNDGYAFADITNKVSGDVFATTTKKFNMAENQLYWVGMGCGNDGFMLLGLSATVEGQKLLQDSTDNVSFILRPYNNSLLVSFFDAKGEAERIGVVNNFNASGVHTVAFEKVDGHWYLNFDGKLLDGFSYERLDNYMEQYGGNTHISIGGRKGFKASGVCIRNKNDLGESGDWAFSLPFGCSNSEQDGTHSVQLIKGAQAVYQKKIEQLDRWDFTINLDVQNKIWGETVVGFLKEPNVTGNYECSDENGVVIKFVNRPTSSDFRTHILLFINGQNITYNAKEPAILDAASFNISIEKNSDRHYYIRIKWDAGSMLVKYQRSNANYSRIQLDDLVENGCYLTVGTNSYDINATVNMKFNEHTQDDVITEDTQKIVDYILEFEKNYDALRARSVKAYETMHNKWFELDFTTRNSISADLMDDEAAYNLLMTVIEYEDGDLDDYYTETEEISLNKSELERLIEECRADGEVKYIIIDSKTNAVIFDSTR